MNKLFFIVILTFTIGLANAQELNCSVTVNADKVPGSNKQVFETLQAELTEFINQTKWTNYNYKLQEKIDCNMTITIVEQNSNSFKGNIQIQSSRPVFNSTYLTPVFNFKDDNFSFEYREFEPLVYNKNKYESNLVSVITYYVYTILGFDAETFELYGGEAYFKEAQEILVLAQQGGYKGWKQADGNGTRFTLIDNLLSPTYQLFRNTLYEYHLQGLDVMSVSKVEAKKNIAEAILNLSSIHNNRPNAFLLRVFMDSKADEIVDIFGDGPYFDTFKLKEDLLKISPINASKWNSI